MLKHKKSLLASGLALLVCFALLMGATFAWFTDSVSNTGNIIHSGELRIDATAYDVGTGGMSVTLDGRTATFEAAGQDLKTDSTPIIGDTLFEPGRSNLKLLQVSNNGTLAAKIKLEFDVTDGGLMDALWFDFVQVDETGAVQGQLIERPMSTLEALSAREIPLSAGESVSFVLIYGMNEEAGNEYQDKTFEADVTILATQYTEETDGFGDNQYDAMADYAVTTAEDFNKALANAQDGETISMDSGLVITEPVTIDNSITIYGNGATIANKIAVDAEGVVLSNLNVEVPMTTADQAAPIVTNNQDLTLIGCEVTRTTEEAQPYGYLVNVGSGVLTAKDTVFTAPYDPDTAFSASPSVIEAQGGVDLDGCVIATDGYGLFSQHVTTGTIKDTVFTGIDGRPTLGVFNSTLLNGLVFDGCTFDMGLNSTVAAGNFTVRNCVFDFTNTPADGAGNALSIYSENGPVVIESNTFRFSAGSQRGVNLTWADWAPGSHDAANVTISGNTFEGTGDCAIRVTNVWENVADPAYPDNTFNGNTVTVES